MIAASNVPQAREQRLAHLDWLIQDTERRETELANQRAWLLEIRAYETGEAEAYALAPVCTETA